MIASLVKSFNLRNTCRVISYSHYCLSAATHKRFLSKIGVKENIEVDDEFECDVDKSNNVYHIPVMLNECCDNLNIVQDGLYIDGTLGGGGHTEEILRRGGKVIGIDQDIDAITETSNRLSHFIEEGRLEIIQTNFRYLPMVLKTSRLAGDRLADGILLDLGVSSYQINSPWRGFAFGADGPLDMRMGKDLDSQIAPLTASKIINEWDATRIANIIFQYGEEPRSRAIAREIIASRPILTTGELVNVISRITFAKYRSKTLARCFQALRIVVNDELGALDQILTSAHDCVRPGGRLVVMSYHSLEDRKVKQTFKNAGNDAMSDTNEAIGKNLHSEIYSITSKDSCTPKIWKALHKRAILPSDVEIKLNRRSRSAKLRIAERIDETEEMESNSKENKSATNNSIRVLGAKEIRKKKKRESEEAEVE